MPYEQPFPHLGIFVGRIVVENDVTDFSSGNRSLNGIEEGDELLMLVALHAASDHLAFEHIKSGKECGGAIT